jgi:hypothetical protein
MEVVEHVEENFFLFGRPGGRTYHQNLVLENTIGKTTPRVNVVYKGKFLNTYQRIES